MALTIRFKTGPSDTFFIPLSDKDRETFRIAVSNGEVGFILADGHEGADCINAYRRMQGLPMIDAEAIGYQVCYSGDITASVLLNLAYGG